MKITQCLFGDVFVLQPDVYHDERGYFYESFRLNQLEEAVGKKINFVQENQSYSCKNVFRGFHFQLGDKAQAKLVRVVSGAVLDIIVNLQTGTYMTVKLTADNYNSVFIPKQYAHGFLALTDDVILQYKVDNYYCKESESGITYNDQIFRGLVLPSDLIVSDKDKNLPKLSDLLLF